MDFCHLIVTCLFSMRRLPFDNQKVKGNYAILFLIASVVGGLISLFVMVIGSQHRAILFDYADPWLWMGPLMLLIGIITATISWQIYYIARTNPAEVIKNE